MHDTIRRSSLAAAALAVAALGAAAAATAAGAATATTPVTIRFGAFAGGTAVACGTPIAGLGTGGTTAALMDLRFYVSNVSLVRRDGTRVALRLRRDDAHNLTAGANRVTLIDLEDGRGSCTEGDRSVNAVVRGTVRRGAYTGIAFTVGVPFALNHTDTVTARAPLNSAAMSWSWQSGRKFTKIEVTDPQGAAGSWPAKAFLVHLGSTGCTGNPATGATVNCRASNRVGVLLRRFNPARQLVAVDLKRLFVSNDVTRNASGGAGCMAGPTDPECAGVFDAFGLRWAADGSGTGRAAPGAVQEVFRARAR
jgi:uncharacterized repeat protein (TIGR04052 family)